MSYFGYIFNKTNRTDRLDKSGYLQRMLINFKDTILEKESWKELERERRVFSGMLFIDRNDYGTASASCKVDKCRQLVKLKNKMFELVNIPLSSK